LCETVSTKAAMIAKAASAAAPIANPFPIAAVEFPNSSRESVIYVFSLTNPDN
jgi:hypothetical protein